MTKCKIPTWSFIRSVQKHKIVQSTYVWLFLLPIFAKFLSEIEDTISIKVSEQVLVFNLELPFTWKAFFISALLFTLANLIYIIFCPNIIKENNDLGEFIAKGKDQGHLEKYMGKNQLSKWSQDHLDIGHELNGQLKAAALSTNSLPTLHVDRDKFKKERMNELLNRYFWIIYEEADIRNVVARFIGFLLYFIAGLIFSFILIQNIFYVFKQF